MPILANPRHEQFAQRVAGGASATQAYVAAGYSEHGAAQSANRLLGNAKVRARVTELKNEISARLTDCSIRDIDARVRALQDRWERMQRVIDARAADPELQEGAGGDTGLLCMHFRSFGQGEDFEVRKVFEVDTGLLKELRAHEEQAAKELGQWSQKVEHSGEVTIAARLIAARERVKKLG